MAEMLTVGVASARAGGTVAVLAALALAVGSFEATAEAVKAVVRAAVEWVAAVGAVVVRGAAARVAARAAARAAAVTAVAAEATSTTASRSAAAGRARSPRRLCWPSYCRCRGGRARLRPSSLSGKAEPHEL